MSVSVLFVCLGNICRSPTAEGVFRHIVARDPLASELGIEIDSAGTGGWHVGSAPDARSQAAAATRGYDLSPLRARQVAESDFKRFNFILAMDRDNLRDLNAMAEAREYPGHLGLLLDFGGSKIKDVPDPYYGGDNGFYQVLDLIEVASANLLQHIIQCHGR
ncbi:low molecular weight protein-tyrosine-phosphatase [Halioxenophilus sp. WMMB6]|uniref:low molecular weight protein-tyrosine-phosphatase n=1 Tax=Halioxenophilus sp. WMMB6 TaxID=3073815 RepID=UPI00295E2318|nr:low molecular weight protein-tyrosine-phosphatase [Halioxenophilus sp. WMMB6]